MSLYHYKRERKEGRRKKYPRERAFVPRVILIGLALNTQWTKSPLSRRFINRKKKPRTRLTRNSQAVGLGHTRRISETRFDKFVI